ncbi:unnamed protein product [Rhizophagus irregularis]|nr:unnamed protein product [Rhizophagus irregularis]
MNLWDFSGTFRTRKNKRTGTKKEKFNTWKFQIDISGPGPQKANIQDLFRLITKLQLPIGTNIPLPKINPNRLTIEELKKKLSDYGIDTDIISDNRVVLAEILQNISNDEISKQVSDMLYNETIDTDLDSRQVPDYKLDFSLSSGWALKRKSEIW